MKDEEDDFGCGWLKLLLAGWAGGWLGGWLWLALLP